MKKTAVIILLLQLLNLGLCAAPRTREQARSIAGKLAGKLCKAVHGDAVEDTESFYVFNYAPGGGFVIVSGDDRMPEIVGYADRGKFEEQDMPPQLKAFLEEYSLTVKRAASDSLFSPVQPLLGDMAWNQWSPYNLQCPEIYGEHAMTGCSATAAAQIMGYYKYPLNQVELSGYTTNTYHITIPAIHASSAVEDQYDWDNMLPTYTGSATEQEENAVAKIMYHVGVAMKMDYGLSGSDADYLAAYKAFSQFGYDTSLLQSVSRSSYSYDEWLAIIMRELGNGRPIFYCGQSPQEGHSFVCDGIDANGLLHINWGWGGSCNGYFDINGLNPADYDEDDSSFGGYCGFNMMVIGITPENTAGESMVEPGTETTSERTDLDASISCEYGKLYYDPDSTIYNRVYFTFQNTGNQDFYGSAKIKIQYDDDESSAKTVYNYIGVSAGKSQTYTYEMAVRKTSAGTPSTITFFVYREGSTVMTQQTFDVVTGSPASIDSPDLETASTQHPTPNTQMYTISGQTVNSLHKGIVISGSQKIIQ